MNQQDIAVALKKAKKTRRKQKTRPGPLRCVCTLASKDKPIVSVKPTGKPSKAIKLFMEANREKNFTDCVCWSGSALPPRGRHTIQPVQIFYRQRRRGRK